MTVLAEAVSVLVSAKSQAGRAPGAVWRNADRGIDVVVYGPQDGTSVVVTRMTDELLAFLGHDPDQVRALLDGSTDDSLGPEAALWARQAAGRTPGPPSLMTRSWP